MRLLVRRKPRNLIVERWDGPGDYRIPQEHALHAAALLVAPGDYIAKADDDDWYPLAASVLARDFDILAQDDAVKDVR